MAEHTPGPYRCGADGKTRYIVYANDGKFVADCQPGGLRTSDEAEANARLFGAAPDLLEAAERVLTTIETIHGLYQFSDKTEDMLRQAIAKATGK